VDIFCATICNFSNGFEISVEFCFLALNFVKNSVIWAFYCSLETVAKLAQSGPNDTKTSFHNSILVLYFATIQGIKLLKCLHPAV
jgi:hypothetical protein